MKAGGFALGCGLDERLSKLILDDVHQLLERVGLEVDHPELLKELGDHEGVTVRGKRVCYSPELVERARAQVAEEDTNYAMQKPGETGFTMYPPFSPFQVVDTETDELRDATDRDVVDGARLYDSFGAQGPVHVHIARMDQRTAQVHIAKLACENSRGVGKWMAAFNYEQAMAVRDMYISAERTEPYVALQMTHSPLRLDAYFLDILRRGRDSADGNRGLTGGGGAMPQPGVSSPIYWRSTAAQGLAEALGAWVTVKFIDPTVHPYSSFTTSPTDMRTCKGTGVLPENYAFSVFNRAVMRELLGITEGGTFGSLDMMFLAAVQGARRFGSAGTRAGAFSLPQTVIDAEKLGYVEAALKGIEFPEEPEATLRIVKEIFPETSFLMHETTLKFRELHWEPRVFAGMLGVQVAGALRGDEEELLPRAKEIARKRVAEHEFELPAEARREIDRIYKRACRALVGD